MDSSNNNVVQGETFLPGQIFVFGGFAPRANSLGHLEQIDSYAPSHQVRFGNLNYTADVCGSELEDRQAIKFGIRGLTWFRTYTQGRVWCSGDTSSA